MPHAFNAFTSKARPAAVASTSSRPAKPPGLQTAAPAKAKAKEIATVIDDDSEEEEEDEVKDEEEEGVEEVEVEYEEEAEQEEREEEEREEDDTFEGASMQMLKAANLDSVMQLGLDSFGVVSECAV